MAGVPVKKGSAAVIAWDETTRHNAGMRAGVARLSWLRICERRGGNNLYKSVRHL